MSKEKKISFGGRDWVIPVKTTEEKLKILRIAEDVIRLQAHGACNPEQADRAVDVILAILLPSYPVLTKEYLEESIDVDKIGALYVAAMEAAGFTKVWSV